MTRQIRTTLLTGLFFFGLLTGLQAQDKYEYGSIQLRSCSGNSWFLAITTGANYSEKPLTKSDFKDKWSFSNITPLIKEADEMAKLGWEVYNVSPTTYDGCYSLIYSIRKSIKQ